MRFFEDSENAKETLVLMSNDDANNKRKIKESNLLKRMAKLWSIF